MYSEEEIEARLNKQELDAKALALRIERLDLQVQELMEELKVDPNQLNTFIENQSNFTEENWDELRLLRQGLEEKLQRELDNIRNPLKAKETQASRRVDPSWLFIR